MFPGRLCTQCQPSANESACDIQVIRGTSYKLCDHAQRGSQMKRVLACIVLLDNSIGVRHCSQGKDAGDVVDGPRADCILEGGVGVSEGCREDLSALGGDRRLRELVGHHGVGGSSRAA